MVVRKRGSVTVELKSGRNAGWPGQNERVRRISVKTTRQQRKERKRNNQRAK